MNEYRFVCYVGDRELDNGHLQKLTRPENGLDVVLTDPTGSTVVAQFRGVQSVKARHPEGMAVYSVGETTATPPWRRFVFVNWGDDDSALEVIAKSLSVKTRPTQIEERKCG